MRSFIFATHGYLSEAFVYSIEMILGKQENIYSITMDPATSTESIRKQLQEIFNQHAENTEYVVLTDILGGSITNLMAEWITKENIHVLTGTNLPVAIELISNNEDIRLEQLIHQSILQGKEGIVYINKVVEEEEQERMEF
ncbi:PTS sugar transporter subunit IIA [Oceanobacillus sp. CFH 90083]|uniref:PTS sugar transporter subunit IIA n=1 Tax=Oceanobacillus sp. CFH 90083 TaxID=2592336 RepID=UPI00128D532D|nr:PTS sugar transporter subunit IIA [Oceanobacillus sp. CFH 90083]